MQAKKCVADLEIRLLHKFCTQGSIDSRHLTRSSVPAEPPQRSRRHSAWPLHHGAVKHKEEGCCCCWLRAPSTACEISCSTWKISSPDASSLEAASFNRIANQTQQARLLDCFSAAAKTRSLRRQTTLAAAAEPGCHVPTQHPRWCTPLEAAL